MSGCMPKRVVASADRVALFFFAPLTAFTYLNIPRKAVSARLTSPATLAETDSGSIAYTSAREDGQGCGVRNPHLWCMVIRSRETKQLYSTAAINTESAS